MKREWLKTGWDLLIILNNHLVMICLGVTGMGLLKQDKHFVWLWSVLFGIPLFFYWVRIKVHKFFLFIPLHLMVPIGIFLLPIPIVPKILMIFISVVYLLRSIQVRKKEQGHGEGAMHPLLMVCLMGGMLLIETSFSQKGWEAIYLALAIIYAAGYYIYIFVEQYLNFLVVNESSAANIPEEELLKKGGSQLLAFVTGMVAFLVLGLNAKVLAAVFSGIGNGLLSLLWKVFGVILRLVFKGEGSTEEIVTEASMEMGMGDLGMLRKETGATLFWEVLEKPITIIVALFVAKFVLTYIVRGIKYYWKVIHKAPEKDVKKINSGIDIRETCAIDKTAKEGKNWFLFLNNREKIRKIYRKRVSKNKAAIIGDLQAEALEYMTAKECCDKFGAGQLEKMYEKARYSEEELTSDDVRAAKSGSR